MFKWIGKLLCKYGYHKTVTTSTVAGLPNAAGEWRCTRKGCDYKIDAVKWPRA